MPQVVRMFGWRQPAIDIVAIQTLDHFCWNFAYLDIQYSSNTQMVCIKKRTRWHSILENRNNPEVVCGFNASQRYWSRWWFQNMIGKIWKHHWSTCSPSPNRGHKSRLYFAAPRTPHRPQPSWTGDGEKTAPASVLCISKIIHCGRKVEVIPWMSTDWTEKSTSISGWGGKVMESMHKQTSSTGVSVLSESWGCLRLVWYFFKVESLRFQNEQCARWMQ